MTTCQRLALVISICLVPVVSFAAPAPTQESTASSSAAAPAEAAPSRFEFGLGMGLESVSGNRGLLWQESGPLYELQARFWLTPQLAFGLNASQVGEFYEADNADGGHVDINLRHLGFDTRYDFSQSAIRPFASIGVGVFQKDESSLAQATSDSESSVGMSLSAGLRVTAVPQRLFVELEGNWHSVSFKDTYTSNFLAQGIENLTGQFFTWTGSVVVAL